MLSLSSAEKQLISCLVWFRSRYALLQGLDRDRKATKENIEIFGEFWVGQFKENWTSAYDSLQTKGILQCLVDEYSFTKEGNSLKDKLEQESPFYQYEYNNYFEMEKTSLAHSLFCKKVYGADFSQHGLVNQTELGVLQQHLKQKMPKKVLDIGCGNGKITEHLANHNLNTHFTGIDISNQAIDLANKRLQESANIHFEVGNMNQLQLSKKYDAILFLDTLYYAKDIVQLFKTCIQYLTEHGVIYAYFSQWIMEDKHANRLSGDKTMLAALAQHLQLNFRYTDLSESGTQHWKDKLTILEEMKSDFEEEGSIDLWKYRYTEAKRYANWGDNKYARYLYEVWA